MQKTRNYPKSLTKKRALMNTSNFKILKAEELKQFRIDTLTGLGWKFGESIKCWMEYRWACGYDDLSDIVARLNYKITKEAAHLEYQSDKGGFKQTIQMDSTACNYGGNRGYFICPDCKRRCEVLYCNDTRYTCRLCRKASYASQSEGPRARLRRKLERVRAALGWDQDPLAVILRRPKGMHQQTYNRLYSQQQAIASELMAF